MYHLKIGKLWVLCIVVTVLLACSTPNEPQLTVIDVKFEDPARLRFSGKGAGAGMMLSSSMGPMGIAIGAAIDEGIGKDIEKNYRSGGYSIEAIVTQLAKDRGMHLIFNESPVAKNRLVIKRFGFTLVRGTENAQAQIDVTFNQNGQSTLLTFPKDFYEDNQTPPSVSLIALKMDPNQVDRLLAHAFDKIFTEIETLSR